ncbi:MAG: hypothetical protein QNJ55_28780, partial [Xenococcus sp. MO_188.B8]|nr:hypothetical protein [Xenococcus sp. MO_188.B8]
SPPELTLAKLYPKGLEPAEFVLAKLYPKGLEPAEFVIRKGTREEGDLGGKISAKLRIINIKITSVYTVAFQERFGEVGI